MTPTSPKSAQTTPKILVGTSLLWDDYEVEISSASLAFEAKLDRDLKRLEDRYCVFQTRRSVAGSLKRQAGG